MLTGKPVDCNYYFPGPLTMNRTSITFLEVGFFFFIFFVLQLSSDLQYYFEFSGENLGHTIIYRCLTTPLTIIPFIIYYKFGLPLLLKKRYGRFLVSLVAFLLSYDIYLNFVDWITAHNPLIPQDMGRGRSPAFTFRFPRQMFWLTFNHLLALTGLGYFLEKVKSEIKLRKLNEAHLQLELQYLKAQLQPHFFFNTLNNIYSLALHESAQTAPTVAKLAALMRYIIYDGNKTKVPLAHEVQFIENYMELEKIRHHERTRIQFSINGDPGEIAIAPLLFIPLVENGFKHGINSSLKEGWMQTDLLIKNSELTLTIRNSKEKVRNARDKGLGLENTKKRLQLLYPGKHWLTVSDEGSEFITFLKLDLQ